MGSRFAASLLVVFASLAIPAVAHAEPSSWLSIGGGYGFEHDSVRGQTDRAAALSATLGVGSSPLSKFVVGGIFRSTTYFTLGTDLGIAARFANGGFARGDWGVALDVGVAARWWKQGDDGRYPIQTFLTLGAPWGIQLAGGADFWNIGGGPYTTGFVGLLELDLLRFTVMRQGSTEEYWRNPAPAGGHLPQALGPRIDRVE